MCSFRDGVASVRRATALSVALLFRAVQGKPDGMQALQADVLALATAPVFTERQTCVAPPRQSRLLLTACA